MNCWFSTLTSASATVLTSCFTKNGNRRHSTSAEVNKQLNAIVLKTCLWYGLQGTYYQNTLASFFQCCWHLTGLILTFLTFLTTQAAEFTCASTTVYSGRLLGIVNWWLNLYAYCLHNIPPLLAGPSHIQEQLKLKRSPLKILCHVLIYTWLYLLFCKIQNQRGLASSKEVQFNLLGRLTTFYK